MGLQVGFRSFGPKARRAWGLGLGYKASSIRVLKAGLSGFDRIPSRVPVKGPLFGGLHAIRVLEGVFWGFHKESHVQALHPEP